MEKKSTAIAFVLAVLLFLSHVPAIDAASTIYLAGFGSNGNTQPDSGTPWRDFTNVCGYTSTPTVVTILEPGSYSLLNSSCDMSFVSEVNCAADCNILMSPHGSIVINGHPGVSVATYRDINFIASLDWHAPLFQVNNAHLEIRDSTVTSKRPLVAVTDGNFTLSSELYITENPAGNWLNAAIYGEKSKIDIDDSLFVDGSALSPIIKVTSGSTLVMSGTQFQNTRMPRTGPVTSKALLISADGGSVVELTTVTASGVTIHHEQIQIMPLINVENGFLSMTTCQIQNNVGSLVASSSPMVKVSNTAYTIEGSVFTANMASGCTDIHISSNSNGSISTTEFTDSVITGSPNPAASDLTFYPPKVTPSSGGQATVCITRGTFLDLADSFGAERLNPSPAEGQHELIDLGWTNITFTSPYWSEIGMRRLGDEMPPFQLYASDLWASNVRILFSNAPTHVHGDLPEVGSIRVDGCSIFLSVSVFNLNGWIDFGSRVEATSSNVILQSKTFSIFGTGPGFVSEYHFPTGGGIERLPTNPTMPSPVFTSLRMTAGVTAGTFTLNSNTNDKEAWFCCTQPTIEAPDYLDELNFTNVVVILNAPVVYARTTGPWTIRQSGVVSETPEIIVHKTFSSPQPASPWSAVRGARPTIMSDVKLKGDAHLYVVDLEIGGDLSMEASDSGVSFAATPTTLRDVPHGLMVGGSLVSLYTGTHVMELRESWKTFVTAEKMPRIATPPVSRGAHLSTTGWLSAPNGGIYIAMNLQHNANMEWKHSGADAIPEGAESTLWSLSAIVPTVELHPSGTSYIFSFPYDVSDILTISQSDCTGLTDPPSSSSLCDWLDSKTLRFKQTTISPPATLLGILPYLTHLGESADMYLPTRSLASTQAPSPSSRWTPTLAVQKIFLYADETPGATLHLDASLSFHRPNHNWVIPRWSIVSPGDTGLFNDLRQFLTQHEGDWTLDIPYDHFKEGGNFDQTDLTVQVEFDVTQATWYPVPTIPQTFHIQMRAPGAQYCNNYAEIMVDAPMRLEYYAGLPIHISAYWDPRCMEIATLDTSFEWHLLTPSGTSIMSLSGSTVLFSFANDLSDYYTLVVNATCIPYGFWSTSNVTLKYQSARPINWPKSNGVVAIGDTLSLYLERLGVSSYDELSVVWKAKRCPNPAYELNPSFMPFPDIVSTPLSYPCYSNNDPPLLEGVVPPLYDFRFSAIDPEIASVEARTGWRPGLHTITAIVNTSAYGLDYIEKVEFSFQVVSSMDGRISVQLKIENPDPPILATGPTRHVVLLALINDGEACGDCHFDWTVNGAPACVAANNPRCVIPPVTDGSQVTVTVYVQRYSVYPSQYDAGEATLKFRTRERPFSQEEPVGAILGDSSARLSTNGWISEYPNLKYFFLTQDCGSNVYIPLNMPQYSPTLSSIILPVYRCANNSVIPWMAHVTDALGESNSISGTVTAPTPEPKNFNSVPAIASVFRKIHDHASVPAPDAMKNFHQLLAIFHPETVIDQAAWDSYKPTAVTLFSQSLRKLMDSGFLNPNGAFVARMVAQPEILARLSSPLVRDALLYIVKRSLDQFPSEFDFANSDLGLKRYTANFGIMDALFDTYFTDAYQVPRPTNMTGWLNGPESVFLILRQIFSQATKSFFGSHFTRNGSVMDFVVSTWTERRRNPWQYQTSDFRVFLNPGSFESQSHLLHNTIYLNTIHHRLGSFPSLPISTSLAPMRNVISFQVLNQHTLATGSALFQFYNVPATETSVLVCATWQTNAWKADCTKSIEATTVLSCNCAFPGNKYVHVALMHPNALCTGSPPAGGDFVCLDGVWTSIGSVTAPTVIIGGPTTVNGNLTVGTIAFDGLHVTLNVTGCASLGNIEIQLSLEEYEQLIASGDDTTILLLTSLGCDIKDLDKIPISVNADSDGSKRCEKISVSGQTTSSTLSALFTIDKSGCKKSSKWWIILVSVLGAIILLAIVAVLLATFTPLKDMIRPHAKRAKESNTYYMKAQPN